MSSAQHTNPQPSVPETTDPEDIIITPETIQNPNVVAYLGRLHPCDWPTSFIIPVELPNGDLPLIAIPSASEGPPGYYKSLESALQRFQGNRRAKFETLVQVFLRWLHSAQDKLGDTIYGLHLELFGKTHYFRAPVTLTCDRCPFMTVIIDEGRESFMTRPLYALREKEAELGVCGHDFAALLTLALWQRYRFNIKRDMYKVHIIYPNYTEIELDHAIIVTANIPGRLLDGLQEDTPKIYHEGLTLTRNTVELPRKDQKPHECQLFQALMAIITEQVETLEPLLIAQYKW